MDPEFNNGSVLAECPECSAACTFEFRQANINQEFGSIVINDDHTYRGNRFRRIIYKLFKCSSCSRPGVAKLHSNNAYHESVLEWFWPTNTTNLPIPDITPEEIKSELREAELCISVEAYRAAAALLRSALEKTLVANGYDEANLYSKIEAAGEDGVITSSRRQRAQDLVRTLGNDVLHEEWRIVEQQEVENARLYVARIIEDFYDDRNTVIGILEEKGRT